MTDPVRDALEVAVRDAATSGYCVPEQSVRTRARRRRTLRGAVVGGLSLALLLGTGAAVLTLRDELQPEPAPPAAPRLSVDAVCRWAGADVAAFPLVPLSSTGTELRVRASAHAPFPVNLRNNRGSALELAEGSAPVLVATADEGDPTVVGLAYLDHTPDARGLPTGSAASYSSFGPFLACPGAPTAADGVHLAPGSYPLHAGQDLGWEASPDVAPFSTWAFLGTLELTDGEPAAPLPEGSLPPGATPAAGSCGWSGYVQGALTNTIHFSVAPRDLLSVDAAAPEMEVQHINATRRELASPAMGGPVLVAMVDRTVVALSRTTDPVPTGNLAAGESVTYRGFEPLVHCKTGEPLPPGSYEFHVGRFRGDAGTTSGALVDTMTPAGVLVVTDQVDFAPRRLASPPIAACGETLPQLARHPDVIGSTIRAFDVIEEEGPGDTGGGGLGPDNAAVTMKVLFDETVTDIAQFMERHFVLLRDGVVVARTGGLEDDGRWPDFEEEEGTASLPDEVDRAPVAMNFWPCDGDVSDGPLVLDGSFTLYGHLRYVTTHELGVRDEVFVEVGPHDFEHHPPVP